MTGNGDQSAAGWWRTERAAWSVFWVLLALIAIWLFHLGEGTNFYRDDWSVILDRDGNSFESFMASHGGQMVPGQVFVFTTGLKLFGFGHYWVFRLLTLPLLLGCSVLVYLIGRRRMGAWGAIAPALALPLLGDSYVTMLWPLVTMTFAGVACFSVAAFLALERRTTTWDVVACILLLLALSLSGFSLPFLAGAAVGVVFVVRPDYRRLWVPVVPAIAYLAWSIAYGTQSIEFDAISDAPAFIGDMAVAAFEGLTGFSGALAVIITIIALGLIAARLVQLRRESLIAWQAAVTLVAFWTLCAMARTGVSDPKTSRYIFPSAFLIVLILVAIAPRARYRVPYAIAAAALVIVFSIHGVAGLKDGSDYLKASALNTRAEFGAAEAGRGTIKPGTTLDMTTYPVRAGSYFAAIDRYGSSPGLTPAEQEDIPRPIQRLADRVLAKAEGIDGGPDGTESNAEYVKRRDLVCRPLADGELFEVPDLTRSPLVTLGDPDAVGLTVARFALVPDLLLVASRDVQRRVLEAPEDSLADPPWRGTATAAGDGTTVCVRRQG